MMRQNHVDLEIVTHCFSGDAVPIYHRLLQVQLSSLLRIRDQVRFRITVWHDWLDTRTRDVLQHFRYAMHQRLIAPPLKRKNLFRRAIGRNISALMTDADVVWFTDCDYLFDDGSLNAAVTQCKDTPGPMVHPRVVNVHRSHEYGDDLIQKLNNKPMCLCTPEFPEKFGPRREPKAIGGLQIVKGDWCREHGYLDGTKWVESVPDAENFLSCKCDVPFRRACGGSTAVDIPGVYRLRHSRAGRDNGRKDHGAKTRV